MPRFYYGVAVAAVFFSLVVPGLGAQEPGSNPWDEPLPVDPAVRIGTLDNGLTYFIRQNDRPEARAEFRLVVNAGSILESEQQLGLAHFLEHMAFNGTEHFEKQELVDFLERIGMRFGPDVNAYTSFDETVYMLTVPTDVDSLVTSAFQVLEDWAGGIVIDPEEVEKERGVVIEEWRLGRGADARMRDQQFPVLFQGSLYAERLPIGSVDVLENFQPDVLQQFYDDWYRPDLMAVVAVGDFDPDRIEALVHEHFSGLTNPADAPERPIAEIPVIAEPLVAPATDPEASRAQVAVTWKLPATGLRTVGDYRSRLAGSLRSGMINRRMYEITQEPGAPFLFASTGRGGLARNQDMYQMFAGVEDDRILDGLMGLLVEAERVSRHGFVAAEFERAKEQIRRGLQSAYDERDKQESSGYAGRYVANFLGGSVPLSTEDQYEIALRVLPTITLDEVVALGDVWQPDEGRVVLMSAPEKPGVTLPTAEEVRDVFEAARTVSVDAYEDRTLDEPLLATVPTPGAIVEETAEPDVGITTWTLSNGVRVHLKPTDFKDDEILMSARSPGGTSLASDEEYSAIWMAPTLVTRGGVGAFDAIQLQNKLAGKVVLVGPTMSPLEEGFWGHASPKDLESMFQLVHLYGTQPRADETAVEAVKTQMRGSLENRSADPRTAYRDTITVTLAQHHPRVTPFTIESVDDIDLERSLAFYRDRFGDFSDFTFTFVGTFDLDEMRPLVETYLASLPSNGREESWRDVGIDPPDGVVERFVRAGIEPRSETQIVFAGPTEYRRDVSTALGAAGSALQIRLREILREDLGGTYFVRAGGGLSYRPDEEYRFSVSFASDPDRADELFEVVMAEIERFKAEGPTEDELAKVKEAERRGKETALRENGYWVSRIEGLDRDGMGFGSIPSYDVIDGWTAEDLRAAAVEFLVPDRYVRVVLLPERPASD